MLRATIRFLGVLPTKTVIAPRATLFPLGKLQPAFYFSSGNKHNSDHTHKHGQHCNHNHEGNSQAHKEAHHEHGPGCKHDHGHHHQHHHQEKHAHQHGPGCNHDHQHHDHNHHAAHPNVKLSKLSFEELIELNTQESLKYAQLIYEQEEKKLKALKEEMEHELKNIEFYKKIQNEVKEKERKIEENIKIYEQEAALSNKRAEKEVEESKTFAVTKIAKELLEVADCIANCKKFALEAESKDKYLELMIQTQQLVREVLKKFEIEEFDPTNKEYDPNFQESLLQIPTPPGCKTGNVAMTMRTGYLIKGRLLRSARVGVFS